ncbi:hypothetical protein GH714_039141 [Hevea brasiliensis]|uniref:Uncharacterized protein n=1 Tax=Hevea brasiliensis TaxID=3981 RepID=A0A6A6KPF2_HEVBR|nr:hypothetical protein GH714_039141 [Hevea brasiliensis]
MHRQKVAEVEKLTQTVRELEEAVLSGGAAANAVRGEKTLEREVARAKVSATRVATVVANEWKDGNDKVMPVKQWLEERRFFQGEMQQLRDKLAVAERAAKTESQLKEKYQLRFKVLEERLKAPNGNSRATSEGRNKDVITLRKACHEKDQSLKDKDNAIEMLAKKVDTLNKAMEVEAKKMRREVAAMEKEVAAMQVSKEHDHRTRRSSAPRAAQLLSARYYCLHYYFGHKWELCPKTQNLATRLR